MIKGGKGGGKTLTGLKFEARTSLKSAIAKIPDYKIKGDEILFQKKIVAKLYKKHDLYKKLLGPNKVKWKKIVSKRLLPDDCIHVLTNNKVYILEQKYQQVAGSVDEKLQTCDFKKKQYQKLLKPLKIKVEYIYVLNDWFKKKEYKDTLKYITSVKCKYVFNVVPLKSLGLPTPNQ